MPCKWSSLYCTLLKFWSFSRKGFWAVARDCSLSLLLWPIPHWNRTVGMSKILVGKAFSWRNLPLDWNSVNVSAKICWEPVPTSLYVPAALWGKNGSRSLFHILKEFRQKIEANALATRSHCNAQWKFQWIYNFEIWYFVTKIVLTYCEKKLF